MSLIIASTLAIALPSIASPITYTETGTMTGSIGGTSFTDAAVTFTTLADTANIMLATLPSGSSAYENAGTTTVTIAGVGTATFTGADQWGAFSVAVPGAGLGIADITAQLGVLANFAPGPPFYDLSTSVTLTGLAVTAGGVFQTTTLGDLTVTGVSGNATFTAVAAAPEPATIAPVAGACLFTAVWTLARRRRRNGEFYT